MFQTVNLCLVTGRMYFYLSPPASNLNNIILILFYFHFLKLNWGCTIIKNKLIEKIVKTKNSIVHYYVSLLVFPDSLLHALLQLPLSLAHCLWVRQRCILRARHICCLCHAHYRDYIILLLLSRVW